MSCVVSVNWVSVECLLPKPCCMSDTTECSRSTWSKWLRVNNVFKVFASYGR